MKTILISATLALLAASGGALAQTQSKSAVKTAGLGKAEAPSNEELNIRAYIELLRTDVKKTKSQIMGDIMELDAGQSAKFWPIYKEFEGDMATLGDQVVALVRSYADQSDKMTDAIAEDLGIRVLRIEDQRNELKKKYFERIKFGLGGIVATRFLQVENQLERLVDLQIAAGLPVVSK